MFLSTAAFIDRQYWELLGKNYSEIILRGGSYFGVITNNEVPS
jgi:hypothetical protein